MNRKRRLLVLFLSPCLIVACMLIHWTRSFTKQLHPPLAEGPQTQSLARRAHGKLRQVHNTVSAGRLSTDWEVFTKLRQEYNRNLAAIPKHKFRSPDVFKYFGPPVSVLLKTDGGIAKETDVKRILTWTKFFGKENWFPETIYSGDKKCVSSSNRNDLGISDAIIVHPRDLAGKGDLPMGRLPHQRLVYLIQESPWATGIDVGDYNGVFNWTSTYRRDSDFPVTFFWSERRKKAMPDKDFKKLIFNILSSKTKMIAYMNSNCRATHTKRLDFISNLQKHIPLDLYGKCGNLSCSRHSDECKKTMSQYKFYLALENSHCRDYLTEKISEPLMQWSAVPVVMGGADPSDYETILPPNSYIHSSGFNSNKELADYLLLLDRSPELYQQYHAWRRTHSHTQTDFRSSICQALHNTSTPVQIYTDFKGWYREDVCRA